MTTPSTELSKLLGVFARLPESGRVKTRLAAQIGADAATRLYEAFVRDVWRAISNVPVRRIMVVTPDAGDALHWFDTLVTGNAEIWTQSGDDLGTRLATFFDQAFALGAESVVVLGTDSPSLPFDLIEHAFRQLSQHDVVIGPATDGGYYLLGLNRRSLTDSKPELESFRPFQQIGWGGPDVLRQTIDRVRSAGRKLGLLPIWYDVDTFDDVRWLQSHLMAIEAAGDVCPCPTTAELLRHLEL
ncbi:MAG: TIGR04282 family arsenosugar biosynthesis glycosyltransferase [Planctomycetaceae bacterium]|nr:TIGR04282 family arsenosugar biosynthesis glycosyltransferase [Planctomycetaceae bacterium]